MKLFALTLFASALFAQQLTLTGPKVAPPGSTVTITASLTGTAGNIVGVQDALSATVPFALAGIATPSTLTTKSVMCAGASQTVGPYTCITIGILPPPTFDGTSLTFNPNEVLNSTPIPDGSAIQTVTFTIPATAASGSTVTITAGSVFAAAADGTAVTISGSSATISVIDLKTMANLAFSAWFAAPTQANFAALIKAIAAAQP